MADNEKILSQEEVSALLDSVGDEEESPEATEGAEESAQPERVSDTSILFPLLDAHQLDEVQKFALKTVLDSFNDHCASALSTELREETRLELGDLERYSYKHFTRSLPQPCSLWSLRMKPVGNVGLGFDPQIVHIMMDLLIGGDGSISALDRGITELDQSVMENIVKTVSAEMELAWSRFLTVEIDIQGRETRPEFLAIYPPAERVISVTLNVTIGQTKGKAYLALPHVLLKELEERQQSQGFENKSAEEALTRSLLEVPLEIEAQTTPSRVPVSNLYQLREGDVLEMDHSFDQPLEVRINDRPKLAGKVVIIEGRKAVELV